MFGDDLRKREAAKIECSKARFSALEDGVAGAVSGQANETFLCGLCALCGVTLRGSSRVTSA